MQKREGETLDRICERVMVGSHSNFLPEDLQNRIISHSMRLRSWGTDIGRNHHSTPSRSCQNKISDIGNPREGTNGQQEVSLCLTS